MASSKLNDTNMMQVDQIRKEEARKLLRKKPGTIYYFIATFFFVLAVFSLILYFVLDKRIGLLKQQELDSAKEELKNIPQPTSIPISVTEGNKIYYIWKEELFGYNIDSNENVLISNQIEGFKDIAPNFDKELLTTDQKIFTISTSEENEVYMIDLTSSNVLKKLDIPAGVNENFFDYDSAKKLVYQYMAYDGLYTFNLETNERKKLADLPGYYSNGREGQSVDDRAVRLSPSKDKLIVQDSVVFGKDPEGLGPNVDATSTKVYDTKGKLLDSFSGTFSHWIDNDKIVYYTFTPPTVIVNQPLPSVSPTPTIMPTDTPVPTVIPKPTSNSVMKIRNTVTKKDVDIMKDVRNVLSVDVKLSTSEILVSAVDFSKEPNTVKNYIFDNSTGLLTELKTSYLEPVFYKSDYILGFLSDYCDGPCNLESDFYFLDSGLSIYNLKGKKETTIIK